LANLSHWPKPKIETLLSELASQAKVTYELQRGNSPLTFRQAPEPTPLQARAYELIRTFPATGN
jgi:hypothetical protein